MALFLAGAIILALYLFVFEDPTKPSDWNAAAEWVGDNIGEDDAFRVYPYWHDAALTHFQAIGGQRSLQSRPLIEDVARYDNLFVVSETPGVDDALSALPFDASPSERQTFGTVTAMEVSVPEVEFPYVFLENLQDARVTRLKDGKVVKKCTTWQGKRRRHDCQPPSRWFFVGEVLKEVGDEPRRCIWAHPLSKGRTLRIEFTGVPLRNTLRIRRGLTLRAARSHRGKDVQFRVWVNGDRKVDETVSHRDRSYRPWDIDTSGLERGDVRIEVETASAKDRFFCINGWVLPEGFEDVEN